jgi:hypothetical protein
VYLTVLLTESCKELSRQVSIELDIQASTDSKSPVFTQTSSQSGDLNREARGPMATIEDDDERLLAEIGYEQVRVSPQISLTLLI